MRSIHLLRALIRGGAHVDIVTFGDQLDAPPPDIAAAGCRIVPVPRRKAYAVGDLLRGLMGPLPFSVHNYRDPAYALAVRGLAATTHYDLLLVEDIVMAQYLSGVEAARTVIDMHNVESHLLSRYADAVGYAARGWYARRTARLLARYEGSLARRVDLVTVCSTDDAARLQALAPSSTVAVVPNGVDTQALRPLPDALREPVILFVGTMDYHANVEAAAYLVEQVLPLVTAKRPEARVLIVGKNPTERVRRLASARVTVTGAVPDVTPYLARAGVVVAPLLVGGGTRLKILEAMATGRVVVSTTVGCEGLGVTHGRQLWIADTPAQLADAIDGLLGASEARQTMENEARAHVEAHYSWRAIGEAFVRQVGIPTASATAASLPAEA